MSEAQRGKIISQEQRDKISKTLKGKRPTDECIAKAAIANSKRRGIHLSDEHKAKLCKPKNLSPEMRAYKSEKARRDMLRIWEERHR